MSRSLISLRGRGSPTGAASSTRTEAGEPRRRPRSALPILAATLLLPLLAGAGCGGDESGAGAGPAETTTGATAPPEDAGAARPAPPVGDGRGGVRLEQIGSFSSPLHVAQPPGTREDLYVVEQGGRIVRIAADGTESTFLDVSDQISAGGERGLLSVAFAPDFRRSGRLYVDFTDPEGNTRVVEYRASDGREADPSTRRDVLRIDQPFANHNGGLVLFGPDDLLYIGTGDGGSANDPERNGQDLSTLLGKLLRIDPRPAPGGGRPYRVPEDNPFTGSDAARGEIYSYGLRNPWRFSFDRRGDALAIGDVGQDSSEEVSLVAAGRGAGANFGWSAFEGDRRFNEDQEADDAIAPTLSYDSDGDNCSVTGGFVVRDRRLRSLYGRYLYGDFCAGRLRSFAARPGRKAEGDVELGLEVPNLSSFGEDSAGRIYAVSLDGPVYRLEPRR